MDLVLRDGLEKLVRAGQGSAPCVSVYMPTGPAGSSREADRGLLRELLQKATARLAEMGVSASKARSLLQPAHELMVSHGDWHRSAAALAVFVAPGFCRSFLLPARLDPLVRCGERFAVLPLLPLLEREAVFYFLFLGARMRKLFAASGHAWRELPLGWAMAPRGPEPVVRRRPSEVEHADDDERALADELRALDSAVRARIAPGDPLVLAGTRELLETFRAVSAHKNIIRETVPVPEQASPAQAHERAWTLARPALEAARAAAATSLGPRLSRGEAVCGSGEIARAAEGERIEEMYVAAEACREDAEDVFPIEAAVTSCLKDGTPLRVVARQAMPGRCVAVAVLKKSVEGDRVES